jgi:DNA-binding LacI/PurR family transcriptional regulator
MKEQASMSTARPTIYDVARMAGVSRSTVSRVINNVPGASPPIRIRVLKVAEQLGYQPSEAARSLATGRARTVDLIAVTRGPTIGGLGVHPYFSRVLAGMMSALEGANTQLRIRAVAASTAADAIDAMDAIARDASVGAILANVTPELAARFHRRCSRTVSLVPTADAVPTMLADNVGGTHAAVTYLHGLGRRRIAAIHGPERNTCARDRRVGYRDAVRQLGLLALEADGGFRREGG